VIVLLYHCKTVLLYRSTLYIKNVIRGETRVPVPDICVLRFRAVNVILRRIIAASSRRHYPRVLLDEAAPGRVETKCHRAFPPDTACTEPVVLDVFY
jgi:hypothetical protein